VISEGSESTLNRIDDILDRMEAEYQTKLAQLDVSATSHTALSLLRAVYRDPEVPLATRIRCAAIALPHESPKLTAIANMSPEDFSNRLEKAITRSGVRLIEVKSAK
jgi:hypothetical protein